MIPLNIPAPIPLTFSQERLWFLEQINPENVSQNISRGIRIKGNLEPDVLQQSLERVVQHHESLRTSFATPQLKAVIDSKPRQLVAERLKITLEVAKFSEDKACAEAQRPFDLTLGPLLRASLLKFDERDRLSEGLPTRGPRDE